LDRGRIGKIKAWLDERFHCYRLIEATQYTRALGTVDGCEHRLILLEASGLAEPMSIAETFMDNPIFPSPGRVRR
jgi:G3E family GTPase